MCSLEDDDTLSSLTVILQASCCDQATKSEHEGDRPDVIDGQRPAFSSCQVYLKISFHITETIQHTNISFKNKTNSVAISPQENYAEDCRLSAKLVPTFVGRECCVVIATGPYGL
jgi:hypothetical protein